MWQKNHSFAHESFPIQFTFINMESFILNTHTTLIETKILAAMLKMPREQAQKELFTKYTPALQEIQHLRAKLKHVETEADNLKKKIITVNNAQ
jgi:hypothetical protein